MTQAALARAARVPQPNLSAYENGRRAPSPDVVTPIRQALVGRPSVRVDHHRKAIRAIVAAHHTAAPRVVGSIARGEDRPGSDIDLLVELTDDAGLLDEVGLGLDLAELFGVSVAVIAADTLREPLRTRMLAEAVPV